MYTFLLSKIEVGSHLYVNITDSLHFHAETVTVTALVVAAVAERGGSIKSVGEC